MKNKWFFLGVIVSIILILIIYRNPFSSDEIVGKITHIEFHEEDQAYMIRVETFFSTYNNSNIVINSQTEVRRNEKELAFSELSTLLDLSTKVRIKTNGIVGLSDPPLLKARLMELVD